MGDKSNTHLTREDSIVYIRSDIPEFRLPTRRGERYEALVPDTLDLQERAALAVNGLTGPTDPDADHELYFSVELNHNPPMMLHQCWDHENQWKFMESLQLARLVSGSDLNEHVERRWMEVILRMQGPDGLLYMPISGRPWARVRLDKYDDLERTAAADHLTLPADCGCALGALTLYALRDSADVWRSAVERLVDALAERSVGREDYAYCPQAIYLPGESTDPNAERPGPFLGSFGGWVAVGLAQAYRALNYEPALELAGKLCRHLKDHNNHFAPDGTFLPDRPGERPTAHFYHHAIGLQGMLEYGMLSGDQEMIDFAHRGFQYGMANGDMLTGYFPESIGGSELEHSEICEVATMIALALKLTEAGAGDYLDDVDRWVRNMFAEMQLTPAKGDWLGRYSAKQPRSVIDPMNQTTDRVIERNIGAFGGWPKANDWYEGVGAGIMHCCTGTGSRAIYYVWENALTCDSGKLRLNLLLNRASPWADVDSHIPYAGQVDVRIKEPVALSIRIPEWVKRDEVRLKLNGNDRPVDRDGRYVDVGKVKPGDVATMTFPITERSDTVWIEKEDYMLVRKGNEVVAIDPPGRYCPLYQRDHYRQDSTRWRKIERFVSSERIYW